MNVVYIHTHDSGRYFQPYGHNIPTPNIMNLAKSGTLFRNAFCVSPTCSPSRASMLTGLMPHNNGMMGLAHRGFSLNDYNRHLVNYLKANGFYTVLCGMQHENASADEIGYDLIHMMPGSNNQDCWDETNLNFAINFLRNRDKSQNLFLSYGMFYTHRPFPDIAPSVNPDYVMPPRCIPDTPETRKDMAGYITSAMKADACVGLLLDELKSQNMLSDCVLLFTTDHGPAFPFMKCSLYDEGTGVALIMDYPGNLSKSKVKDSLVSHLDIFPTLCDILGLKKPEWLQGHSLLPLFENEKDEIREELFTEVTFHASYEPMRSVRTNRYKYIRLYNDSIAPANIDNSPTKDLLLKNGLLSRDIKKELLFDLLFDPCERVNLSDSPEHRDIYVQMKARLDNFMERTNDPLTSGFVKRNSHVHVNKQSCIDPDSNNSEDYEISSVFDYKVNIGCCSANSEH